MLLSKSQTFWKIALPYPDKKVFKIVFGMSTTILKWSHGPDLNIFWFSCFKIGQCQPRVAYKSVAYKRKSVYEFYYRRLTRKIHFLKLYFTYFFDSSILLWKAVGGPLLIKKGPGRSGTNTLTISAFHRFGMKREVKKRPQGQPRTQEAYYFDVIDGSLFDLCAKQMPWVRGCVKGSVYSTTIRIRIYNRVEVQVGKKRITPRGLLRDHHKLDSNALWFFY